MMTDLQVSGFNVDKQKMARDLETINELLRESGNWTGGLMPYPEEHFCCKEYEDWEGNCDRFLRHFKIEIKSQGFALKSACAEFIVSELGRLSVEIPQNVYKWRYLPLEDKARYLL